jgi:hypothetical protein
MERAVAGAGVRDGHEVERPDDVAGVAAVAAFGPPESSAASWLP